MKKFVRPQQKNAGCGSVCLPFQPGQEAKKRRITVQASMGKRQDPISKIIIATSTGDVSPAVECLPSKCKDLSSNPNHIK
jgi:hypothetical protein